MSGPAGFSTAAPPRSMVTTSVQSPQSTRIRPFAKNARRQFVLDKAEQSAMGLAGPSDETAVTAVPQQHETATGGETSPLGALASAAGLAAGAAVSLAALPLDVVGRGLQSTGSLLKGSPLSRHESRQVDVPTATAASVATTAAAAAAAASVALQRAREDSRRAEEALARTARDVERAIEVAKLAADAEVAAAKSVASAAQRALELEREKRINHTAGVAVHRLLRLEMARAWTKWAQMAQAQARNLRLLKRAHVRMTRPKKVAAFSHWRRDWDDAMREAAVSEWENAALEAIEQVQHQAAADVAAARAQADAAMRAAQAEAAEAKALAEQMRERLAALEAAAAAAAR